MNLMDKEKVIKGLNCCSHTDGANCIYCPYDNADSDCTALMSMDVLALLIEQEAKCLTKAELDGLKKNQFVWIEGRTGYLYCLQIIGICRDKTGVSDIQFNAVTSYVEKSTNLYGENYRIWTNKPTEEQKQEVKWDG